MELLGHTDINTTMNIYSHVAAESQRIAADPVEAAKWGVSQSRRCQRCCQSSLSTVEPGTFLYGPTLVKSLRGRRSSVVEQLFRKQQADGSNPPAGSKRTSILTRAESDHSVRNDPLDRCHSARSTALVPSMARFWPTELSGARMPLSSAISTAQPSRSSTRARNIRTACPARALPNPHSPKVPGGSAPGGGSAPRGLDGEARL